MQNSTKFFKSLATVGGAIGKGLIAGFVGTVAITVSQMIEMQITKRKMSNSPVAVGGEVLGVEPKGKAKQEREKVLWDNNSASSEVQEEVKTNEEKFSQFMHFGYGTGWGVYRGALDLAKINGARADLALFGGIWTTAQIMLPAVAGTPPIYKWSPKEIAIDVFHHAVYAIVAGRFYEAMRKAEKKPKKSRKQLFI